MNDTPLGQSMLIFNGSEDYRHSEDRWLCGLTICNHKDKELSSLNVYEGGESALKLIYEGEDHFFCHDLRFVHVTCRCRTEFIVSPRQFSHTRRDGLGHKQIVSSPQTSSQYSLTLYEGNRYDTIRNGTTYSYLLPYLLPTTLLYRPSLGHRE